jgi:hypothetical protein
MKKGSEKKDDIEKMEFGMKYGGKSEISDKLNGDGESIEMVN